MTWDYAGVESFLGLRRLRYNYALRGTARNSDPSPMVVSPGSVSRKSAISQPLQSDTLDAVLTDPPYYDNVPYAALSDFFYVWLKRAVGEQFPDLFATPTVPKSEEIVHDRPHDIV